jgi:PAS domain S-box-containing protein
MKKDINALFESIVHFSNDAIISKSLNQKVTSWNNGAEILFGYSAKEIIGKNISLLIPYNLINEHNNIIKQIINGKYVRHHETQRLRKDGSIIQVSLTISPIKDIEGKIIGISIIARNITERIETEEKLKRSLKEISDYQHALDESSIVAITDGKGIIKHANDNYCKISKYTCEELIGKDHNIIIAGFQPTEFIAHLWNTVSQGKIWRGELKNKAKDGSVYWADTTIVPFLTEDGIPYQCIAIRSDITLRKKTEFQLAKNMIELEYKNKELEQFAYVASHDLQEPLRMVASFLQLLERRYKGKLDNDADDFIHFAVDGAKRMKQLISDLLCYSRTNTEGRIEQVNMNQVLKNVLQNLSTSIQDCNATVNYMNLPFIEADRTQMGQLLQNLLSNALKFRQEKIDPVINIKSENQNGKWLFSLNDNGIGIEEEYAEKVFTIFKRLHTKEKYEGTGIGLAIAKKIVERHGGEIWFKSEIGKGTTFFFTLNSKL